MNTDKLYKLKLMKNYNNNSNGLNQRKIFKENYINLFMITKLDNPKLKQQQICDKIGISSSTLKRYMNDLGIKSFYRHDHSVKSKNKTNNNNINLTNQKKNHRKVNETTKKRVIGGSNIVDNNNENKSSFNYDNFIKKPTNPITEAKNKIDKIEEKI